MSLPGTGNGHRRLHALPMAVAHGVAVQEPAQRGVSCVRSAPAVQCLSRSAQEDLHSFINERKKKSILNCK